MKIAGMYNVPFPNGKYKELKWIRHNMELWGKEIEQTNQRIKCHITNLDLCH